MLDVRQLCKYTSMQAEKTHQDINTWLGKPDILICSPNKTTDATIERTIAAAAEKPFIMLSVYFTTTDVYRPPTLAKTGGAKRNVCSVMELKSEINQKGILRFGCTYILQSTPRGYSRRRNLSPGPYHHRSCKLQSEWPRCQTGTFGCFSPKEMCLSSSTPFQSTHLHQEDTKLLSPYKNFKWSSW